MATRCEVGVRTESNYFLTFSHVWTVMLLHPASCCIYLHASCRKKKTEQPNLGFYVFLSFLYLESFASSCIFGIIFSQNPSVHLWLSSQACEKRPAWNDLFLPNFLCSDVYNGGESALMYFDMTFCNRMLTRGHIYIEFQSQGFFEQMFYLFVLYKYRCIFW